MWCCVPQGGVTSVLPGKFGVAARPAVAVDVIELQFSYEYKTEKANDRSLKE